MRLLRVHGRAQSQSVHAALIAEYFLDDVIPHDADAAFAFALLQAILHDLLRLQFVAAMHQRDMLGNVCEVERFLDRRVAAADDRHALLAEEKTIAGRTGGDATTLESLLGRQPEIAGRSACRNDQRIAGIAAAVAAQQQRPC